MKKVFIILIVSFLAIGLQNCKKEKPDPCEGYAQANATFTIGEFLGNPAFKSSYTVETDTALIFNYIQFVAEKEADSYQWIIGTNIDTFKKREVTIIFPPSEVNKTKKITLVSYKKHPSGCPNDVKEYDTVVKYLTLVPTMKSKIWGYWQGSWEHNPNDTFTLSILPDVAGVTLDDFNLTARVEVRFINLTKGKCVNTGSTKYGYKISDFYASDRIDKAERPNDPCSFPITGIMNFDSLERLNTRYTIEFLEMAGSDTAKVYFTGKKIN